MSAAQINGSSRSGLARFAVVLESRVSGNLVHTDIWFGFRLRLRFCEGSFQREYPVIPDFAFTLLSWRDIVPGFGLIAQQPSQHGL